MDPADLSLVETSDGLQVVWKGRNLYEDGPASTAARKALTLPVQHQTLYLLASPVAWHGVREFLRQLPDDSAILAVEAEPVLLELARRLLAPDDERLMLCAADPVQVRKTLADPGRYRRVRDVTFSRGALAHRDRYRQIKSQLDRDIRIRWQNKLTLSDMGRLWTGNVIRNLPRLARCARIPKSSLPLFVCGAGPSLTHAVDLMRSLRDRIEIMAVDTALPSLEQAGLHPDVVVAVEGQLANVYDFLPVSNRDYTLVADLASSPAVIGLHPADRTCWISSQFADTRLLARLGESGLPVRVVPPLGSVGVTAAALALDIAHGPVLFTGLDFAYGASSRGAELSASHAPGSPGEIRTLSTGDRLHRGAPASLSGRHLARTGVDGGPVFTTLPMIGYAEQLVALVESDRGVRRDDGAERPVVTVEPFGLFTGAQSVTADQARSIVARSIVARSIPAGPDTPAEPDDASSESTKPVDGFVTREISLLERLGALLQEQQPEPADLESAFRECDYVAIDFPDYDGEWRDEPGFLARVRVAVGYYVDRWERTLKYLRS